MLDTEKSLKDFEEWIKAENKDKTEENNKKSLE